MVAKHRLSLKRIPEAKAESRFGTGNVQNKPRIFYHTIKCENYQRLLGSHWEPIWRGQIEVAPTGQRWITTMEWNIINIS